MASDFEIAFRHLLKSVVQEVARELLLERDSQHQPSAAKTKQDDESILLLRSREAAKRLQVSERHLQKLTQAGILPCVRVGQCVRYSVETIQKWIHDAESNSSTPEGSHASEVSRTVAKAVKNVKTSVQKSAPRGDRKKPEVRSDKAKQLSKRRMDPRSLIVEPAETQRITLFDHLLEEIGVDRCDLPPVTNGELMRIAEVDVPTIHGWIYQGRQLPAAALEKLRDHFGKHRKDNSLPEIKE
jgi:excisionase family DNA binding protein